MAIKMAENSLFAILLRSPWWYSAVAAGLILILSSAIARGKFLIIGVSLSLPFFAIAFYAAFKQFQRPSPQQIAKVAAEARKMSAAQVAGKVADSYIKERFDSTPFKGKAADLELTRGYRKLLLSSKRFKAANTGVEPLKQLVAAGENAEATGYLYVTLGEVSANAREFARENNIEIIQSAELAAHFSGKVRVE